MLSLGLCFFSSFELRLTWVKVNSKKYTDDQTYSTSQLHLG